MAEGVAERYRRAEGDTSGERSYVIRTSPGAVTEGQSGGRVDGREMVGKEGGGIACLGAELLVGKVCAFA